MTDTPKAPGAVEIPVPIYVWNYSETVSTAGYWSTEPPTGGGNPSTRFVVFVPPDTPAPDAAIRAAALVEAAGWHDEREKDELALSNKYRGGSSPWFAHCQMAKFHRESAAAIRALIEPKGD